MRNISLAYAGVHQIFQLALAAHEIDELEGLLCSFVDGPRKWGRAFGKLIPSATAKPLGSAAIPPNQISEFPWPLLLNRLGKRLLPWRHSTHYRSSIWFDYHAERWLRRSAAKIFVGGETCALETLKLAARMGMTRILDCPGIPAQSLDSVTQEAADDFAIKIPPASNDLAMIERKSQELREADVVLCCSEFQRAELTKLHPYLSRTEVSPLWADFTFWQRNSPSSKFQRGEVPLRVIYAGAVSLKKGVPYLLRAVNNMKRAVNLTIVGPTSAEMASMLDSSAVHQRFPYLARTELRRLFHDHDVLVMPSLGDSFGFVALEAMAAGIPVIVSNRCGVPVPSDEWRVPARSSAAIESRLQFYLDNPANLQQDGLIAAQFSRRFTPSRYRNQIQILYRELLGTGGNQSPRTDNQSLTGV